MRLEHTPEKIIHKLLVDLGLDDETVGGGDTPTIIWRSFRGEWPDKPENIIGVTGTVGLLQGCDNIEGEQTEKFGIQVRVRCVNKDQGYRKAKSIFDEFARVMGTQVELTDDVMSATYIIDAITHTSPPIRFADTQSRLQNWTFNAVASIELIGVGTGSGTGSGT